MSDPPKVEAWTFWLGGTRSRAPTNTAAIYDKHVTEGPRWLRDALSKMAGWRLKRGRYTFPIEQKLYDVYVKATGQIQPGAKDYQPVVDA